MTGCCPKAFSRVTARHGEPWFAVLLLTAGTLIAVLIFGLLPTAPLNAYAYMGTLSGYFFIAVYLMVIAMTLLRACHRDCPVRRRARS